MAEEIKRGRGRPPKQPPQTEPTPSSSSSARRLKNFVKKLKTSLVIFIILVVAGLGGFFGWRYHDAQQQIARLKDPTEAAKVEAEQLVNKVGKLTELPKGETPTIATVQDLDKLKGQSFFADAQNGDKALIYTQAKKAFLYRPSTNKLINIAPLNIGANPDSSSQ